MKIIQNKLSKNHNDATFYSGIVAYHRTNGGRLYLLRSVVEGEINFRGKIPVSINEIALLHNIDDDNIDDYVLVDGWLGITELIFDDENETIDDEEMYDYDDGIEAFIIFCKELK